MSRDETKLEAIKSDWQSYRKSGDLTMFSLYYSKQIDWLIEQAEKVEELEKEIQVYRASERMSSNVNPYGY